MPHVHKGSLTDIHANANERYEITAHGGSVVTYWTPYSGDPKFKYLHPPTLLAFFRGFPQSSR